MDLFSGSTSCGLVSQKIKEWRSCWVGLWALPNCTSLLTRGVLIQASIDHPTTEMNRSVHWNCRVKVLFTKIDSKVLAGDFHRDVKSIAENQCQSSRMSCKSLGLTAFAGVPHDSNRANYRNPEML